jgi:hypothetical protein
MWFSAFLNRDSFFTWPRTNQGSKEMHFPMVPRISVNIYNSHELRFVFYSLASAKSPPNCANPVALISPFAMRQIFRFPAETGVMSTNGVAPALRWPPGSASSRRKQGYERCVATAHETNASNTYGSWGENYCMLEKLLGINKWEWFSGSPCKRASKFTRSYLQESHSNGASYKCWMKKHRQKT